MRHKILVFDLDGTLCQLGKGMHPKDAALLRQLEEKGHTIVVCSGKTTYYLCGFLRQVGLKDPIMVGENGGAVQFGIDLPPRRYAQYPVDPTQKKLLVRLREEIDEICGDRIWYQPNEVQLTPFPKDEETFGTIRQILEKRQPDSGADWKAFGEKLSGHEIPDYNVETFRLEYENASAQDKDHTGLGRFIIAALAQKSMVTNRIYKSGNLLAGYSAEYDGRRSGIKDYLKLLNLRNPEA